jgi:hypothetical protein
VAIGAIMIASLILSTPKLSSIVSEFFLLDGSLMKGSSTLKKDVVPFVFGPSSVSFFALLF